MISGTKLLKVCAVNVRNNENALIFCFSLKKIVSCAEFFVRIE